MTIKGIEAREKAATAGPWARTNKNSDSISQSRFGQIARCVFLRDTEFIAHAREDIPCLLAQLREAREKLEAVNRAYQSHGYSHAAQFLEAVGDILYPKGGD